MRYLILAQGGVDKRWLQNGRPFLGVPKQLVTIDGETLLERTVRLLRARGAREITITAPAGDERFAVTGAKVVTQDQAAWPTWPGLNFVHTRPLWAPRSRTTILLGDVFYTEDAIDQIDAYDEPGIHMFRRPAPREGWSTGYDEPFAVTFTHQEQDRLCEVAEQVAASWSGPKKPHLWHLLAALNGVSARHVRDVAGIPGQTHIDDLTDDFDTPAEWAEWVGRYYNGRYPVAVCIPWFGGDRHRTAAWKHVSSHYGAMGVPVYVGEDDTGGEWTNRSRGCNNAVAAARADGAEIFLIGDADTFVPSVSVCAAAHAAATTGQLVRAYEKYEKISANGTRRILRGYRGKAAVEHRTAHHVSGAVVVTAELWDEVGGFDERFDCWGGEDRAFWMACFAMRDGWHSIPGAATHLWHPHSPERSNTHPGRAAVIELGRRYKRASGWLTDEGGTLLGKLADQDTPPDLDALSALMGEPGGPLDPGKARGSAGFRFEPAPPVVRPADRRMVWLDGPNGEERRAPEGSAKYRVLVKMGWTVREERAA